MTLDLILILKKNIKKIKANKLIKKAERSCVKNITVVDNNR